MVKMTVMMNNSGGVWERWEMTLACKENVLRLFLMVKPVFYHVFPMR